MKTIMNRRNGTVPFSQFLGSNLPRAGRTSARCRSPGPRAQQPESLEKHGLGRLQNQGNKPEATALGAVWGDKKQPPKIIKVQSVEEHQCSRPQWMKTDSCGGQHLLQTTPVWAGLLMQLGQQDR